MYIEEVSVTYFKSTERMGVAATRLDMVDYFKDFKVSMNHKEDAW
jgi:hypothetical protein